MTFWGCGPFVIRGRVRPQLVPGHQRCSAPRRSAMWGAHATCVCHTGNVGYPLCPTSPASGVPGNFFTSPRYLHGNMCTYAPYHERLEADSNLFATPPPPPPPRLITL